MPFAEDKAGVLASEAHRYVLAALTTHFEDTGVPLHHVMVRVHPHVIDQEDVEGILGDLQTDGLAETANGAWRMTEEGFNKLTGPIANEPPPGATPAGPALITMPRGPVPKVAE